MIGKTNETRTALASTSVLLFAGLSAQAEWHHSRVLTAQTQDIQSVAPELVNLTAEDVSFALERNIPHLKQPYVSSAPKDRADGIPVGVLSVNGGDRNVVMTLP